MGNSSPHAGRWFGGYDDYITYFANLSLDELLQKRQVLQEAMTAVLPFSPTAYTYAIGKQFAIDELIAARRAEMQKAEQITLRGVQRYE